MKGSFKIITAKALAEWFELYHKGRISIINLIDQLNECITEWILKKTFEPGDFNRDGQTFEGFVLIYSTVYPATKEEMRAIAHKEDRLREANEKWEETENEDDYQAGADAYHDLSEYLGWIRRVRTPLATNVWDTDRLPNKYLLSAEKQEQMESDDLPF